MLVSMQSHQSIWHTDWVADVLASVSILLAIGIPLFIYWLTKRSGRKRLSYVVYQYPMSEPTAFRVTGFQMTYNGVATEKPRIVIVGIVNNGRQPIRASDYESPLSIKFSTKKPPVRLLDHQHDSATPDLEVVSRIEGDRIVVDPLLLNPDDFFSLAAVTDGGDGLDVSVHGRISDISKINELPRRNTSLLESKLQGAMAGSMVAFLLMHPIFLLFLRSFSHSKPISLSVVIIYLVYVYVNVGAWLFVALRYWYNRRRLL